MIPKKEKETVIREVMKNYPEAGAGSTLSCQYSNYKDVLFSFLDEETGKKHTLGMKELLKGFDILLEEAIRGNYQNCNFPNGALDAGNWDGLDTDALVQCALFGKVVYG